MANPKIVENAVPCPFCGSTDIHYSIKSVNNGCTTHIHAACYCKDCNTYGPRILSEAIMRTEYKARQQIADSPVLRQQAIDAWNKRITIHT